MNEGLELTIRGLNYAAVKAAEARGVSIRLGRQNDYPLTSVEGAERRETVTLSGKSGSIELDCLMSCNSSKNIVATAITGMSGTIKEYVTDGDVQIAMEVTLLSDDNSYPTDKVETLCELLRESEALLIANDTLNDVWGVSRVVVTSWSMTPTKAFNYQTISMQMASDEAYVIMEEIEA